MVTACNGALTINVIVGMGIGRIFFRRGHVDFSSSQNVFSRGHKVVKFHFSHSKPRKPLFLLKI